MSVLIDNDSAVNAFSDRIDFWIEPEIKKVLITLNLSEEERDNQVHYLRTKAQLFYNMYEDAIDNGCFSRDKEISISVIVDNDIINYCTVIDPDHEDWSELKEIYDTEGCCDISEYTFKSGNQYSFLEQEYADYFLIRD